MGEGRFEHVPGSDDLSGCVDLTDLAEPLAQMADILAKLETCHLYKDHPGVYEIGRRLNRLSLSYITLVQDI